VTDSQRREIFECLRAAYGGELLLYRRLWHTPLSEDDEFEIGEEWEVTPTKAASALEYVSNGFRR